MAATVNSALAGVSGTFASKVTNNADAYFFGVIGDVLRDSSVAGSVIPRRSGGVLGNNGSGTWGALGYKNSGGNSFGVYTSTLFSNPAEGTGKIATNTADNGIGLGVNGGFMGGYVQGSQYGMMSKGKEFGMYVAGNTLTNKPIVQLNEGNNQRVATYTPTSTTVDVNTRGKGKLANGETFVAFDKTFAALTNTTDDNLNITITPTGATNGVYISEITANGFYVKENNKGTSNASFNWMAVGIKKGYEKGIEISSEILANDFDTKMSGVMHNDGDTKTSGSPIYFDGNKVRFENMPEDISKMASTIPAKKIEAVKMEDEPKK